MNAVVTEITSTQKNQPQYISNTEMLFNPAVMEQINSLANLMASGKSTVPSHLQKSPGDCFAIIMQAAMWQMNPYSVAQKTHLVNGVLGYEAQLVNAVISSSRAIYGRFKYEYEGDWSKHNVKGSDAVIRVGAVLSGEDNITWGEWLHVGDVTTKNSPLWKTAPKQQAAYLAVKYWARIYCPEVIMGVYSPDELQDRTPVEREINPVENKPKTSSRADAIKAKAKALADKKKAVVAEVAESNHGEITLAYVCEEIAKANDNDDLALAADLANMLNDHDKGVAREEYRMKIDVLNA